jgi:uncharacterized protein
MVRVGAASLLAMALSGCTGLFFYPQRVLFDTPENYHIKYQVEDFKAADGTSLNAWFFPAVDQAGNADPGKATATVLFLHGNAENISSHFRSIAWLPAEGFNVLALDYRGYGASEGVPSVEGAQLDIDAAMRHLLTHEGVDPKRIVILGQSLGGALAIYYAAHSAYRADIRAVVIDSSFYDYRQIAREKMASSMLTWPLQWLPWLTINDDYSPADSVAAISPLPLLLIRGDRDIVVPPRDAQELFDHARDPKELWTIPGAGHTQAFANKDVRMRLVEYLKRYAD